MTPVSARGPKPPTEAEIVRCVARSLEAQGYRVRIDPDGTDYFDLVARKDGEIGLIEAKVAHPREVWAQALRRRGWGDWNAVVLARPVSAERLAARTAHSRGSPIGVWSIDRGEVRVHRPARPWVAPPAPDPYAELRERFRRILDALEDGTLPPDARWAGVPRAVRRASRGRGFAEWRLDEPSSDRA